MTSAVDQETPGAQLARLRDTIRHEPDQADGHVRRQLASACDAGFRCDLMILLAETYQQQDKARVALDAIVDAAAAAGVLLVAGGQRPTVALGVAADLEVWDGQHDAVPACTSYYQAAVRDFQDAQEIHGGAPDERRAVLAGALRAVAVYHREDCDRGRRLLSVLLKRVADDDLDPTAFMLRAGLTAMDDGCRPYCQQAPVTPVPPLPGGILNADLDAPAEDYLASRIRKHPATHTCGLTARPAAW